MRHNRQNVIERTIHEFELLDRLVANLTSEEWDRSLQRPETKDPWTIKDALAHITYWKANVSRFARKQRKPIEERGLNLNQTNHLVYVRWHDRTPREVLVWHRQVQNDVLAALQEAHDDWFSGREHSPDWPGDLDGHSSFHRVKDIEGALHQPKN
jgi:hypothetical protein